MDTLYYILFWIIVGVILTIISYKYINLWKVKKRLAKAKKSELKAIKFLEREGFKVVDLQSQSYYTLSIDDKPLKAIVKADMIVKKGNKVYVAEVKTGEKAPSPRFAATRRQLLEYYLVYKPHGLLLVDMEKQKIHKVDYSILNTRHVPVFNFFYWPAFIFFIGFVVGFLTRSD